MSMHAKKEKCYGSIIVDACTLMSLSAKIPGNQSEGKHFYDILPWLAEHDFKIIIPEMVTYETSQILTNGSSVRELFSKEGEDPDATALHDFLKDVSKGKYRNMHIAETFDLQNIRNFLGQIHQITNSRSRDKSLLRHKMVELNRRFPDRKNWGDHAIRELAADLPEMPFTIVFTQDMRFLNEIRNELPHVSALTPFAFFLALTETGLRDAIPFIDKDMNAFELFYHASVGISKDFTPSTAIADPSDSRPIDEGTIIRPMFLACFYLADYLGYDVPYTQRGIVKPERANMTVLDYMKQLYHADMQKRGIKPEDLRGGTDRSGGLGV